jgi:hypothetical protein
VIYLTKAVEQLYDELEPAAAEPWLITANALLRWIREHFLAQRIIIRDENLEEIRPHPGLTFGYGGKNADQVRLYQTKEGQRLPVAEWGGLIITQEHFGWLQQHLREASNDPPEKVAIFEPAPEGEAVDTVPGTRHRRGAYEPDLEAYMIGRSRETLAQMTDEGVAQSYRNQIERRIKAGTRVPTIPSHSNWLRDISAKVRKIRKRLPTGSNRTPVANVECQSRNVEQRRAPSNNVE